MNDEKKALDIDVSPEVGIQKTRELIGEVGFSAPITEKPAVIPVDSAGRTFDAEIHKSNPDGSPVIGSRGQLLLKPEAKKSIWRKAQEGLKKVWNGEDQPEKLPDGENQPASEIPLSDHEFHENQQKQLEKEQGEQLKIAERHAALTASSENSAELFFLGGSVVLGIEFLNQRSEFHPAVAAEIYRYEQRTGKSIDLPPGVALAFGLGRIGWEIVQREPACKERFDAGAKVVRENVVKFIGKKLPRFGRSAEPESEK